MDLPLDFSILNKAMTPYPASVRRFGDDWVLMAHDADQDWLLASGAAGRRYEGTAYNDTPLRWVKAPLNSVNAAALRDMFPFTSPAPVLKNDRTIGLGDRLGIAGRGHIMSVKPFDAVPVLAQQSPREISLTGRSFSDVLDAASFSVFCEGFTRGFGADGDHLKTATDVKQALNLGYTMITLDCSEHIRSDADTMSASDVGKSCALPHETKEFYLNKSFMIGDIEICMTLEQLQRNYLKYGAAIDFACDIYDSLISGYKGRVELEISLDETDTPTRPDQHFFTISELIRRGVILETVAPRFVGEFQKGVDYIGNLCDLKADLKQHAAIARHFGYKLSIHSGSDKFSAYDIIGRETLGRFHIKTSGTSWLTAMQLIAEKTPELYRQAHRFALASFEQARKHYYVTTDLSLIPDVDALSDPDLKGVLSQNNERQLMHITYGLILTKRREDGSYQFKDAMYSLWRQYMHEYADMLKEHIGAHLSLLYKSV